MNPQTTIALAFLTHNISAIGGVLNDCLTTGSQLPDNVILKKDDCSKLETRGHSKTTCTNFCPILTTYLPIMDFSGHLVHYLPFVHVDIEKNPYPLAYLNLAVYMYLVLHISFYSI